MKRLAAIAVLAVALPATMFAQERDRSKVADRYKWDLAPLYTSEAEWRAAKDKLESELPSISQHKGTLAISGQHLYSALDHLTRVTKDLYRLYVYASLQSDIDTRIAANQALQQEMSQLATRLSTEAAFVEPEILKMDRAKVNSFIAQEPRLAIYRQYLDDIVRRQAHTLSAAEEKIIADAGLITEAPADTYGIFSDADFPYASVKLSDGEEVLVDKAGFNRWRAVANR
jgi:oligoendopeptidase F